MIHLLNTGKCSIDLYGWHPVEFWGYTTWVRDRIFEADRIQFDNMQHELVEHFQTATIRAYHENKCAFGFKSDSGKMLYLGFYDFKFTVGLTAVHECKREPLGRGSLKADTP